MKSIKSCLIIFLFFSSLVLRAGSLTLIVTQVPINTPANDFVFVAGSFNTWNPGNANFRLNSSGIYQRIITINNLSGNQTFKFTRGTWETVEGNASGGYLPDRSHTVVANDTLFLTIQSWEGNASNSTAANNVQILSNSFNMPELNRNRRIWLYLPPDYQTAQAKRYPVIYIQDGQNVFDAATSFSGEWEVDETLNQLFSQGNYGAIVVAIDNGGGDRLNEYSPWVNSQYGGGQGNQYVDFLKNTLKPYIDNNYRTLTTSPNTAIIGSSMGGLISMYANAKYPSTFGKAGIFSPAFWFSRNDLIGYLNGVSISAPIKNYYVAGTNESSSMMTDMQNVRNLMLQKSSNDTSLFRLKGRADGAHSEWFWRREFRAAYLYLFSSIVPETVNINPINELSFSISPNPTQDFLRFEWNSVAPFRLAIFNTAGALMTSRDTLFAGDTISCQTWPSGIYLAQLMDANGKTTTLKWVKE